MANLRSSRLARSSLDEAPLPTRRGARRWLPVAVLLAAGLLVLAWFDGGEEALHPIAEDVALPEQGQ